MTTDSPPPNLEPEVDHYSEYTTTNSRGLTETTIQFTIVWPVERPYDGIPSGITFDHRDRLVELAIRPGPLKQDTWSYGAAFDLLESAVEASNPPFTPSISINAHHTQLWRTHIEADRDDATGSRSEILDWLNRFLTAYRTKHETPEAFEAESKQSLNTCFGCGNCPATHIVECRVTEAVEEDLAVCSDCTSDFVSYPFVKSYTSLTHPAFRRPLHN